MPSDRFRFGSSIALTVTSPVVVIPPNTPVQFTEVNSGEIVYLVVRIDPGKNLAPTH